jgi:hypothetical protein
MKICRLTFINILCLTLLASGCGQQQTESADQNENVSTEMAPDTNPVSAYLEIKNSLIASDADAAANAARAFVDSTKDDDEMKFMAEIASTIHQSTELETQRASFEQLSDALIMYYSENDALEELYVQFCPMAFNNNGGYWISDSEEVLNPYFGDLMLRCGYVSATLR